MRSLLLFALLWAIPSVTLAQTAIVIVDSTAAPRLHTQVSDAAIAQLAESGIAARPAPPADILVDGSCNDTLCLREVRTRAAVDLLVHLTLHGSSGSIEAVAATVIDNTDHSTIVTVNTTRSRDVQTTARLAVAQVMLRRMRGPGAMLAIRGAPDGAVIEVDGTEVGLAPWEAPIEPGHHRVSAIHAGLRRTEEIDIDEERTGIVEVRFDFAVGSTEGVHTERRRPIIGPSILGIVGLAGVTAGVVAIAGAECTGARDGGDCLNVGEETNWGAVGLYGGGGLAAIAGAVLWYFLGTEEVQVSSMPGVTASIQISGHL